MSVLSTNELKERFAAGDKPSAKDFSDFIDSVQNWIATASASVVPGSSLLYSTATLISSTYTAAYTPTIAAYNDGTYLAFKSIPGNAPNPAGGTSFNAGLGPKPIVREFNIPLKFGDIRPGQLVEVRYDLPNNRWVMTSPTSHPGLRSGDIIPSAFILEEDGTRFLCNGQEVSASLYPSLAVLGSTYGSAGAGNVKLPDFSHRFPVGIGNQSGMTAIAYGDDGGEETHLLVGSEAGIAAHQHFCVASASVNVESGPVLSAINHIAVNAFHDPGSWDEKYWLRGDSATTLADPTLGLTSSVAGASASTAHNTMPPFLACYYYILV